MQEINWKKKFISNPKRGERLTKENFENKMKKMLPLKTISIYFADIIRKEIKLNFKEKK